MNEPSLLIPDIRQTCTQLGQAFIKTLIFYHLDHEYHVQIETNTSNYTIDSIFSWITLEIGHRYHVAYSFSKIILTKTCYEMHNTELLAIVKVFKNWHHYLKRY